MKQETITKSRIQQANWYDYPHYYDIAFQGYTWQEANFIEAACRKYCRFDVRRLLEPACGSGRLINELAARGYETTGFDLSRRALIYLRGRLLRRRLYVKTFAAEMSDFCINRSVDAAYCMVNSFRHLLTEQAARHHLECVADSLCPGGIYVLGFHLRSDDGQKQPVLHWRARRGQTEVTMTLRVLQVDHRARTENLRVCLLAQTGPRKFRLRHEFQLRTYTPEQFGVLLDSVPLLELCDVYDFRYDIEQPLPLNDEMGYAVFVLRRRLPS